MKFIQHYSSSSANLYEVVADNGRRLLLECGLPWSKLEKALDFDLSGIDGCLVTHEHKDHSKAAWDLMQAGIDVYASEGTLKAIGLHGKRRAVSIVNPIFNIGKTFGVLCFDVNHDTDSPVGYIVHEHATGEDMLFVPESSFIRQRFTYKFTIVAIGCSYNRELLTGRVDNNDINLKVAKRIVKSHAEKNTTLNYLQKCCDLSRCREIHLLHCSGHNLDKSKTQKEFKEKLFIETVIKGV